MTFRSGADRQAIRSVFFLRQGTPDRLRRGDLSDNWRNKNLTFCAAKR
jgi:hypothetical protein